MEAIWKLRVGAEAYYLSQVARGLDEYYTGAGEAPGFWTGGGIEALGLTGEVDPADLRAVLAGLAPGTGLSPNGTALRVHPRRVPGFDLTFAVPKSVSTAYALGDRRVQHLIVGACEAALGETLAWLEREACFVRRGTNKAENREAWGEQWGTRRMVANGFVAAAYRHRTSRAGDPHLHWHVLVANLAQGIDGRWSALDGRAIYDTARTGGAVFQAAMRRELSAVLGVEWGPVREDAAEIAGIPDRLLRTFSQRHEQIVEWLESTGESGPAATATAQRATRQPKQESADFAAVEALWNARADALGWGPAQLEQLLASVVPSMATDGFVVEDDLWRDGVRQVSSRLAGFEEWLGWLLDTRVTAHDGTFTRFELTRAVTAALSASTSVEVIETAVQRALASAGVVAVGDHWEQRVSVHAPCRIVVDDRALRYTSRSLLAVEARLLEQLSAGVDAGHGILDTNVVDAAIAGSTLGYDQADAVRTLTSAGDRVAVMVGRAGTGKTHTLGTLRSLYESAGFTVVGLAPSARAARELQTGAGIESATLARHLVEGREIDATTVVVVDEAGMAGVRDLARVIDQVTRIGAKVVLVGDHHQLPEVAAGGGFRAALDLLGGRAVELTVNRRQQHAWEQAALNQLRDGEVAAAFAAYRLHGRAVLTEDHNVLREHAISDWQRLRGTGDTLMLAGTRAEAARLNRVARDVLLATGELDVARQVELGGRLLAPGEEVILRRNNRGQRLESGEAFAVDNGTRAVIVGIDDVGVHIVVSSGERVVLDHGYVSHGWVEYGYASTVHAVQGVTCDHVLVVGPAGLYREGIYVALSRARLSAWIYATASQAIELDAPHGSGIALPTEVELDPEHELVERMHTSGSKTLVTMSDPDAALVSAVASALPVSELVDLAGGAREAECAVAAVCVDPATLRADFERAASARSHIEVGRRVRALDRDNVGRVMAIDDDVGSCVIHFVNDHGRSATRVLTWHELVVIDEPDAVDLTEAAAATLDRLAKTVARAEDDWAFELSAYGIEPGDADRYRRAVHVVIDRAAHHLRGVQPEWLTTWLGRRPSDGPGATVWDDATAHVARFRVLHGVDDETPGLGPRPDDPDTAQVWQRLMLRVLEDRCWLLDRDDEPAMQLTVRSAAELVERRDELEVLMRTAPPDQQAFIDRLTSTQADAAEVQANLLVAARARDARRDWIIANWPHVVELEQITALIAAQPPLAHWPASPPPAVRAVLDTLTLIAPTPERREERSLADIERDAVANDRVRRLERRSHDLDALQARAATDAEREAIGTAIHDARDQLRVVRHEARIDAVFAQYGADPTSAARERRAITLAHDTLADPPAWVIDQLCQSHDKGQLRATRIDDIVTRVLHAAAYHDQYGCLPGDWWQRSAPGIDRVVPDVDVPTLEW